MKRGRFKRKAAKNPIPDDIRFLVETRDRDCRAQTAWPHICWGALQLHHKLPRSRGGAHTTDNLVRVCAKAHDHIHGHPTWAKTHDLLR